MITKWKEGGSGNTCAGALTPVKENGHTYTMQLAYYADPSFRCRLPYLEWNISSIPSNAIITKAAISYPLTVQSGTKQIQFREMLHRPSTSSNQVLFDDVRDGTIYATVPNRVRMVDLGSNAVARAQYQLTHDGWFAIGINGDTDTLDNTRYPFALIDSAQVITLTITYRIP